MERCDFARDSADSRWFCTWTWQDLGPFTGDRVDYPDFAQNLCRALLRSNAPLTDAPSIGQAAGNFGILICGSGQGMAMTAIVSKAFARRSHGIKNRLSSRAPTMTPMFFVSEQVDRILARG